MRHVSDRRKIHGEFWWENHKKTHLLEDLGVCGKTVLKLTLKIDW
jgi:hypothetical protein